MTCNQYGNSKANYKWENIYPRSYKKQDGAECQGMGETLQRWVEWAEECFSKEHNSLKPKIEHITMMDGGNEHKSIGKPT